MLCFSLRKDIYNYRDINLISFVNSNLVFYLLNIYSDDYQSALKYLKDIKANLSNVIIITGDFNIRDSNWNLLYLYHSTHADTLSEVANVVNLK